MKSTSLNMREMETSFREVTKLLSCSPNSISEVLKEKMLSFENKDGLVNQRHKDMTWIQELGNEIK
jgi:hypothetical protein